MAFGNGWLNLSLNLSFMKTKRNNSKTLCNMYFILFGHKGIECMQILYSCVSFCVLNLCPFLVKERKRKFVTVSRIKASAHAHTHTHTHTHTHVRVTRERQITVECCWKSHKSFNEQNFQARFITLRWLNVSGWQIVLDLDEHQTCHSSDKTMLQPGLGAVTVRITCSWEKFLLTEIKHNCQNHLFLREVSLDGN